jgi:selenocysteine-specific elongation factor
MKSLIIGTAGHIDHGKTSLVKALTGIDADRLAEEKRRGITIDLGFAHMDLAGADGETLQLGFVDVPGHERFVRNMLAGVGGMDLVLLVIAADESIKPQTREHFDILRLLGVRHGITVLTKADAVDRETLDVARMEVEEFLRGTFLETPASPIIAVSSRTDEGMEELKREIVRVGSRAAARDSLALPRLPIDRVFTMKGFGTVVTGTLLGGTIRVEDELELHPGGMRVRVRGVQVHGEKAVMALAGQRTALNLAGVEKSELARGMMLTAAGLLRSGRTFDARIEMLPGVKMKKRMRAHFHAHTFEVLAGVVVLNAGTKSQGPTLARIKLPEATQLLPGDRFILRRESPLVTIGGGVVLDNHPPRRATAAYLDALEVEVDSSPRDLLRSRVIASGTAGLNLADAVARTGLNPARVVALLQELPMIQRFGETLVVDSAVETARRGVVMLIETFHKQNPLAQGIGREELRGRMPNVAPEIFDGVLRRLVTEAVVETGGEQIWMAGRRVVMRDEEAESKQKIEQAFAAAGLQVPALEEVLAGLNLDPTRAQKLVTLLLRENALVKISADLVFHRNALDQLRSRLLERKAVSPKLDVAAFKEMTGVSRKYAIPLLEYLDRERVTRRAGDAREIL